MRFLLGTDWHLRTTKPAIRLDNFIQTQLDKVEFVFQQAQALGCPILHNGDLFDVYDPPTSLVYEFISLVKRYNVDLYINPGNHDLYGGTLESLPKTALGILYVSGVVKFPNGVIDNCNVLSIPYSPIFDPASLMVAESNIPTILLVHNMITSRAGLPYEHYPIESLKTNADLVICGHWHSQFQIQHGLSLFVNAGPLTRQSKGEMSISPAVLLVDVRGKYDVRVESIAIPHKSDVFDMERAAKKADDPESEGIAEAYLSVMAKNQLEATDIYGIVRKIGSDGKFKDKTIEGAVKTVQTIVNNW